MNLITVLAENIVPVHLYLLHWGEKKLPLNSPTKPPLWFCRFHLLTGAFKQSKTCMIKKPWWHCIKKKGPVELPSRLLSNQKQGRFSSNLLVRESVETSVAVMCEDTLFIWSSSCFEFKYYPLSLKRRPELFSPRPFFFPSLCKFLNQAE